MSATTKVKTMWKNKWILYPLLTHARKYFAKSRHSSFSFRYCPSWSYTLFKTHLNPWKENIEIIKKNNVKKVVVTYRDLRDVVVARYYRLLNFPKKK